MKHIISFLLCIVVGCQLSHAQRSDNYRGNLRNRNVKVDATNLPIVFLNVSGKMILRDSYILAKMKIIDNGEGMQNHGDTVAYPGQHVDHEGWIALRYRGNSSFDASDKKPFAFRTLETNVLPDNGGNKKKVKLLGMPKDNKWCFIAPWCDETMFRDVLSFELARPWFDWVPNARMCELFLDGTYYGVFVLCEQVSKGKHRLNLDDPGSTDGDLTGDYHVIVDHGYDPYFVSKYHPWQSLDGSRVATWYDIKYEYGDPDDDEFWQLPTGTRQALHKEVEKMEDAFMAPDWQAPDGGYRRVVDVTSFIDYMLATELSMNIDGYRLSTHLYKHGEKRAEAEGLDTRWKTTLWDFNIAWGNANYYDGSRTDRWQYQMNIKHTGDNCPVPFYWYRMLQDTAYVSQLRLRWQEYRQNNHSDERLMQTVDSLATLIQAGGAAERNERAWGIYSRTDIWPLPYYASSYADAVRYLKDWIRNRLHFMDKHLLPPRIIETEPVMIASGWNADIIAESLPASSYTTRAVDGSERTFYSASLRSSGGLPSDHELTSANENVLFRLGSYAQNNALSLQRQGQQGTLRFEHAIETSELFVLATSGNGESQLTVHLNYADGTSVNAGSYNVRDWSVRKDALQGTEAIINLGNIRRDNNTYSSDNHYCLFDFSVPVDKNRQLQSVTFTTWSSGYAAVMAVSMLQSIPDGIEEMMMADEQPLRLQPADVYSLGGIQQKGIGRGINILRYPDGRVRKRVGR